MSQGSERYVRMLILTILIGLTTLAMGFLIGRWWVLRRGDQHPWVQEAYSLIDEWEAYLASFREEFDWRREQIFELEDELRVARTEIDRLSDAEHSEFPLVRRVQADPIDWESLTPASRLDSEAGGDDSAEATEEVAEVESVDVEVAEVVDLAGEDLEGVAEIAGDEDRKVEDAESGEGAGAPVSEPVGAGRSGRHLSNGATGTEVTDIFGVGPKVADYLASYGVMSLRDVASLTGDELQEILDGAGRRFAICDPSTWPEQAAQLIHDTA